MKNIDYLELFFRKHNLSGKIKVKYSSPNPNDDFMTDIEFENGDVININDVIFDIESEFPNDLFDKWITVKRENDISFIDWMQTNTHYVPNDIDNSTVKNYQTELEEIVEDVKRNINSLFELEVDEGDSDYDEGESEDE